MEKELIYSQYAGFKEKHKNQLDMINENGILIYIHFERVLAVLENLYDHVVDEGKIDDDMHEIFSICFSFLIEKMQDYLFLQEKVFLGHEDAVFENQELVTAYLFLKELTNDLQLMETIDQSLFEVIETKTTKLIEQMKSNQESFDSDDFYNEYEKLIQEAKMLGEEYINSKEIIEEAAKILEIY